MEFIKRDPQKGYLDAHLWIPKSLVNVEGVKNSLTFELFNKESVRYLLLWEETEHHIKVPRAFWKSDDFECEVVDCRPQYYKKTNVKSRIKLDHIRENDQLVPTGKTLQREALQALLKAEGGTLQLGCGKGKSVVALELAAQLQVPTLIVVDNTHLLEQWNKEVARHLEVPGGVGLIKGDVRIWKKNIVLATYQTLASWADEIPEEVRRWFGLTIWDEGHHVNAPVFSKSAPLFYGKRIALSATPDRQDGLHVICHHHIGPVVYKDVKQDLTPAIYFRWTALELDNENPQVLLETRDVNGEIHLGKLAVYFGGWRKRLTKVVLPEVDAAYQKGRKILVLSNSVNEVVNLMTLWTEGDPNAMLFSEIPIPTKEELNLAVDPEGLDPRKRRLVEKAVKEITVNLAKNRQRLPPGHVKRFEDKLYDHKLALQKDDAHKLVMKELRKRQKAFLEHLLTKESTAGLFTEMVPPELRYKMLKERRVIFAIMKYGKEGLDDKDLD